MTRSGCVQILLILKSLRAGLAGSYDVPGVAASPPSMALGEKSASLLYLCVYLFLPACLRSFIHHTMHLFKVAQWFSVQAELYSHHL